MENTSPKPCRLALRLFILHWTDIMLLLVPSLHPISSWNGRTLLSMPFLQTLISCMMHTRISHIIDGQHPLADWLWIYITKYCTLRRRSIGSMLRYAALPHTSMTRTTTFLYGGQSEDITSPHCSPDLTALAYTWRFHFHHKWHLHEIPRLPGFSGDIQPGISERTGRGRVQVSGRC